MARAKVYSGLDLQGQRLSGLGQPEEPGDATPYSVVVQQVTEVRETLRVETVQQVQDTRTDGYIVVGPQDTAEEGPHLFVQTGLGPTGNDMTFWIEDGL